MRTSSFALSLLLVASTTLADGRVKRFRGVQHVEYNARTGQITWTDGGRSEPRNHDLIWQAVFTNGEFFAAGADAFTHDWGDIHDDDCVGEIEIGYATTVRTAADGTSPLALDLGLYIADNGFDSSGRGVMRQLRLRGLPARAIDAPGETASAFIVTIVEFDPLRFVGPDLDPGPGSVDPAGRFGLCADDEGLSDFAYSFRFRHVPGGSTGPLLAWPADPNSLLCLGPGASESFDVFALDPNHPPADPNAFIIPDLDARYRETVSLDTPTTYGQLYMRFDGWDPAHDYNCGFSECQVADIVPAGGDCLVDLSDLSTLLANFGLSSGATRSLGDIDPPIGHVCGSFGGDGDIDLSDLALMLSLFGTDCN